MPGLHEIATSIPDSQGWDTTISPELQDWNSIDINTGFQGWDSTDIPGF